MFKIIIDSREKQPYKFKESVTRKLETGDYSLVGYEDQICVERKSKTDAYSTIGNGRARFIRELQRMTEFTYAAIVVESSLSSFLEPPQFSRMKPQSAIASLISWSLRYRVHVFFADNRELAKKLTKNILEKFWKQKNE